MKIFIPFTKKTAMALFQKSGTLLTRLVIGAAAGLVFSMTFIPATIHADPNNITNAIEGVTMVKNGRLTICKIRPDSYETVKQVSMIVTAYSSAWDETTGIPGKPGLITASGKQVEDGIIANNMLPFGTKVRIPELYGDKVFIVEDRLHQRKGKYHVDIWFDGKEKAKEFGVKLATIEILES